jgi:hypothetical protein
MNGVISVMRKREVQIEGCVIVGLKSCGSEGGNEGISQIQKID